MQVPKMTLSIIIEEILFLNKKKSGHRMGV